MLTEAIIQTSTPTSLKIIDAGYDEILRLKSISGLSSAKVTQFTGDFAREGSYYQGRRAQTRNPVFNFVINPNFALDISASDIREMLYRMFMEPQRDSDAVQVLLKDDRKPDRYFIGYTETIEADAWTQDLTAQVSLNTTDAYLRSAELTQRSTPQGWFKLPLDYEGSADTGIVLEAKAIFQTPKITLANGPDVMVLEGNFQAGDVISINTIQGERYVRVNGVDRLGTLTAASRWLSLKSQDNVFMAYGSAPNDGNAVLTSYSYRAAWWGI